MTQLNTRKKMPESRFKHCYKIAEVMEYVAKNYYNYNNEQSAEMFMLGYIHDSMYDYESNETLHNEIVAELVPQKYKESVKNHSTYQTEYQSDALDMLYFADQIVDGNGNICSFDERIADILARHGTDDGVYQDTIDIVNYLNSNELFKKMEQDVCSNESLKNNEIPISKMAETWYKTIQINCKDKPELYLSTLLSEGNAILFTNEQKKVSNQIQRQIKLQNDFAFLDNEQYDFDTQLE